MTKSCDLTELDCQQGSALHQKQLYSTSRNLAAAVSPTGEFSAEGYSAAETSEYDNMGTQVQVLCQGCNVDM